MFRLPRTIVSQRSGIVCFEGKPLVGTASAHGSHLFLASSTQSALDDRRFDPVQLSEVEDLSVGVSFLVDYEDGKHAEDWEVGTHGIIINFTAGSRSYSATFLPEVAEEQGWDQKETLKYLIRKAGYEGKIDQALLSRIKLTRYQSSKAHMTYDEYAALA